MKCAVDGNAGDVCAVPAFTVTDKPLVAEAANVVCTSAPTLAPTHEEMRHMEGMWTDDGFFIPDESHNLYPTSPGMTE